MKKALLIGFSAVLAAFAALTAAVLISIVPLLGPLLAAHEVASFFSSIFGGHEKNVLTQYLDQSLSGGQTIRGQLGDLLDCQKVDAQARAGGWCVEHAYTEQNASPIPTADQWLIPIWKKAAARYKVPWELLAAINAARTSFGDRNCSTDTGIGFYNMPRDIWDAYKVDAGTTTLVHQGKACSAASPPFKLLATPDESPGSGANAFDPVDATFAWARFLAKRGVTAAAWNYSGGDPGLCDCNTSKDGEISRWSEGMLGFGVGATPDRQHLLKGTAVSGLPTGNGSCAHVEGTIGGGIPRNYLILYDQAATAFNLGTDGWAYLAAVGACETSHGQSSAPGVRSGVNAFGCCSGPMQFNLKGTWHQPGALGESLWPAGNSGVGYASDYNKDGAISVWDPRDAVAGAAKMLGADGAPGDWSLAANAYNNSSAYAQGIALIAQAYLRAAADTKFDFAKLLATASSNAADANAKPTDYSGPALDDVTSLAVHMASQDNVGPENWFSDCYVAVVHEWYLAIVADGESGIGTSPSLAKMVKFAVSKVGTVETGWDTDNGGFIDSVERPFGLKGAAWCAMFVSWAAKMANVHFYHEDMRFGPKVLYGAYVPSITIWANDAGLLRGLDYKPHPGDLTVFRTDHADNLNDHIGIVVGVNRDGSVRTVEGNTGNPLGGPDGVFEKTHATDGTWLIGYVSLSSLYSDLNASAGDGSPGSVQVTNATKPPITHDPINYTAARKTHIADYTLLHNGHRTWQDTNPQAIVWHYTVTTTYSAAHNQFLNDVQDPELHTWGGTCAQFVVDADGTIYQQVPLTTICRHTVGLNDKAIGIEMVGMNAQDIFDHPGQERAVLKLTLWLMDKYNISVDNVIGHAESLSSPLRHELQGPPFKCQTHGDWTHAEADKLRAALSKLAGKNLGTGIDGVPLAPCK